MIDINDTDMAGDSYGKDMRMGFLDSLLRQSAKKIISEVADAAMDAVRDEFASNSNRNSRDDVSTDYEDVVDAQVEDKLRAVFAREFPQYEIKENVSPTTLGGTGKFMNYTFGVYENGAPKLFIMVVLNNDCVHRTYRWSKEEAERAGVTMINFVAQFENRIDYIIDRLHQYL